MNSTAWTRRCSGSAGCALADIGYPDRALPILRNAVEINPANAQAWAALGSACLLTRRVEEAVRHLTHGINISPLDSRLSDLGRDAGACVSCSRRISRAPCARASWPVSAITETTCHGSWWPGSTCCGMSRSLRFKALNDAYRIKPDLAACSSCIPCWVGNSARRC